jgi:hypothetical protein
VRVEAGPILERNGVLWCGVGTKSRATIRRSSRANTRTSNMAGDDKDKQEGEHEDEQQESLEEDKPKQPRGGRAAGQ